MKILLIGPYGIGNTILALPAMKILREHYPEARIDLLTLLPSTTAIVKFFNKDFNIINNLYSLNSNKIDTIKEILKLRKIKYDYSILLFPSARIHYNIISFLCKAKKRIGSKYPDINFRRGSFLNNINIPVRQNIHDVYQNIRLLRPLINKNIENIKINKLLSKYSIKTKKKVIGIHPGCKKEAYYKKWHPENFLFLINKILTNTNYTIKIFFGPDELNDIIYFNSLRNNKRIKFIINLPLSKVIDEINECKIFLSNDSGLMHLANFLGSFNIVIQGPSDYRRTAPFNNNKILIYDKSLKCIPCSHTYLVKSHKFKCIYNDIRCLKKLSPEYVWKNIKHLFN